MAALHLDNHALYYRDSCMFCQMILHFMNHHGIRMELRPVSDPQNLEELIRVGGKDQVPCLFIDGQPLYESDDIVDYLRTKLNP